MVFDSCKNVEYHEYVHMKVLSPPSQNMFEIVLIMSAVYTFGGVEYTAVYATSPPSYSNCRYVFSVFQMHYNMKCISILIKEIIKLAISTNYFTPIIDIWARRGKPCVIICQTGTKTIKISFVVLYSGSL